MGFVYEVISLEEKNLIDLNRHRYLGGNAGFDPKAWALEGSGVPAEVKASRDEVLALTRDAVGAWTPHARKLPWLAHEDMDVVCQF